LKLKYTQWKKKTIKIKYQIQSARKFLKTTEFIQTTTNNNHIDTQKIKVNKKGKRVTHEFQDLLSNSQHRRKRNCKQKQKQNKTKQNKTKQNKKSSYAHTRAH
jgi:hypothetical protein